MRAVVQRVLEASVTVDSQIIGQIGPGLMVLIAAGQEDTDADAKLLAEKIAKLRIFNDEDGKMNLSVTDMGGDILGISQFTLFGDARKGRRPSFVSAMEPNEAERLYNKVIKHLQSLCPEKIETGRFRADMKVALINDGPITILLDTQKTF